MASILSKDLVGFVITTFLAPPVEQLDTTYCLQWCTELKEVILFFAESFKKLVRTVEPLGFRVGPSLTYDFLIDCVTKLSAIINSSSWKNMGDLWMDILRNKDIIDMMDAWIQLPEIASGCNINDPMLYVCPILLLPLNCTLGGFLKMNIQSPIALYRDFRNSLRNFLLCIGRPLHSIESMNEMWANFWIEIIKSIHEVVPMLNNPNVQHFTEIAETLSHGQITKNAPIKILMVFLPRCVSEQRSTCRLFGLLLESMDNMIQFLQARGPNKETGEITILLESLFVIVRQRLGIQLETSVSQITTDVTEGLKDVNLDYAIMALKSFFENITA